MARRAGAAENVAEGIEELAANTPASDPNAAPANPGNYPSDSPAPQRADADTPPEPPPLAPLEDAAPETPPLDAAPVEAPAEEPADDAQALRDQLTNLQAAFIERSERQERELEFLRRGASQASQPAAAPVPEAPSFQNIMPFQIDGAVMQQLGLNPEVAPIFDTLIRASIFGAVQRVLQWGEAQAAQQGTAQQQAERVLHGRDVQEQVRSAFWSQNADLEPYAELVRLVSQDIKSRHEAAGQPIDPARWLHATSETVRGMLTRAGINPRAGGGQQIAGTPAASGARIRPATGETGTGRVNGRTALTPMQQEIMGLVQSGI